MPHQKSFANFPCDERPFVNEAGVNLQEARTCLKFFPRIGCVENSTHADDRHATRQSGDAPCG